MFFCFLKIPDFDVFFYWFLVDWFLMVCEWFIDCFISGLLLGFQWFLVCLMVVLLI